MNIRDIKIYLGITKLKYNLDIPKIMQSTTAASADHGMTISFAKAGDKGTIVRISGDAGTKKFLNDLGFTVGVPIQAVSDVKGNKILCVRGSRVAVDSRMASKILFRPE